MHSQTALDQVNQLVTGIRCKMRNVCEILDLLGCYAALVTDVSEQPIGAIVKGYAFQEEPFID